MDHLTLVGEQALRELVIERDALRARLAAAAKVVEAARKYRRDPDDCMVPIGGGNPYYHCKHCGVTNVQLNMGESSQKHAEWCEYRETADLAEALSSFDEAKT